MRTDELRDVLHRHGEDVHDTGAHARVAAVHDRVHAVRRRRSTVAGGAAVAAVVAVALVVVPWMAATDPEPADAPTTLAGFEVPRDEVATGYTYEYARGVEAAASEGPLELDLPPAEEPRLLMWASSADDAGRPVRLHLRTDGQTLVRASGDFEGYDYLEPWRRHRVALRQQAPDADDRVALAVFELADDRPEGVSGHGMTFRAQQLDDRLVAAEIGDPGQAEVTTEMVVPQGDLRISDVCAGSEVDLGSGYLAKLWVDERFVSGGTCQERVAVDAGTDGEVVTDVLREMGVAAGDTVTVRLRLVHRDDPDEQPVAGTDAVLAVAGYEVGGDTVEAAGWEFPERLEHDGHEWQLSSVEQSRPGEPSYLAQIDPLGRPAALATAHSGFAGGGRVVTSVDAEGADVAEITRDSAGTGSWGVDAVLQPGRRYEVGLEVRRGLTSDTRLGLGVYALVH